jgi:hypothetical protein
MVVAVRKDYVAPTELLIYTRTFLQRCRADGAGDSHENSQVIYAGLAENHRFNFFFCRESDGRTGFGYAENPFGILNAFESCITL